MMLDPSQLPDDIATLKAMVIAGAAGDPSAGVPLKAKRSNQRQALRGGDR